MLCYQKGEACWNLNLCDISSEPGFLIAHIWEWSEAVSHSSSVLREMPSLRSCSFPHVFHNLVIENKFQCLSLVSLPQIKPEARCHFLCGLALGGRGLLLLSRTVSIPASREAGLREEHME